MTDRYTELVKQAYEAQQAREGERYQALTSDLAKIDNDLRVTAALREATVASLEAMDDAVEAAREALDAYFAGREEGDDEMFEPEKPFGYIDDPSQAAAFVPALGTGPEGSAMPFNILDDEYASAKSNGALTD